MISNKNEHVINLCDTDKKIRSGEPVLKPKCVIDHNKVTKCPPITPL